MAQWQKEGAELENFDKLMMEEWGKNWEDEGLTVVKKEIEF